MFAIFLGPQLDHPLMVLAVVADVAREILLFQAADPVHQAGRARQGPGPRQAFVAGIGRNGLALRLGARDASPGSRAGLPTWEPATAPHRWRCNRRTAARTGVMNRTAIRQASNAASKHSAGLRHASTGIGDFAIAAEQDLQQIRLLRLGRQARARTAPLHADDHQRQFQHDRQPHGFALQGRCPVRWCRSRPWRRRTPRRSPSRSPRSRPPPERCGRRSSSAGSIRAGCPRPA